MVICVCGGRKFARWALVHSVLDRLVKMRGKPTLVIHGGAHGADAIAHDWARKHFVEVKVYRADWDLHGRAAGPIRNRQMAAHPGLELVVAFPGAKGTANMIEETRKAGVEVIEVDAFGTIKVEA